MYHETQDLDTWMSEVDRRLCALEQTRTSNKTAGSAITAPESSPRTFWALEELQRQRQTEKSIADGVVMLVGSVTLVGDVPVEWQEARSSREILDSPWEEIAASLAALGHPVRLQILQQVLSGIGTTADIAEALSLSSAGQLHHHLRQLVSAGWLRHAGRAAYEVPASRIVPLLVIVHGSES